MWEENEENPYSTCLLKPIMSPWYFENLDFEHPVHHYCDFSAIDEECCKNFGDCYNRFHPHENHEAFFDGLIEQEQMTWENKKKSIVIMLYLDENNSHSTVYIHPIEEILASTALDPNAKPFEMKFSNLNQDDVEPILLDKTQLNPNAQPFNNSVTNQDTIVINDANNPVDKKFSDLNPKAKTFEHRSETLNPNARPFSPVTYQDSKAKTNSDLNPDAKPFFQNIRITNGINPDAQPFIPNAQPLFSPVFDQWENILENLTIESTTEEENIYENSVDIIFDEVPETENDCLQVSNNDLVLNPNAEPFDPESPCSSTLEFDPNLVRNDISFEFFENKIGSYESPINEDDSEAFIEDQMYSFAVPFETESPLEFDFNWVTSNVSFGIFGNEIGSNESPINEDSESFFEDQIPLMNPNATPFEPVKTVGNDVSFDFFENEVGSVESETTFFEGQIIPSMNPNAVPFEPPNRRPISSSFELNEIIKSEC